MSACQLRVYAYPEFQSPLRTLLQIQHLHSEWARDCKWHTSEKCQSPKFTGAGSKNNRQYQSDLVIWRALMNRCPHAYSPQYADLFLVPYLFGTGGSQLWGEYFRAEMRQRLASLRKNSTQLCSLLPHLNAQTASRHVLLMTLDVEFVDPSFHGAAPPLLADALFVHLGDDHLPSRAKLQARIPPLKRALTVPSACHGFQPVPRVLLPADVRAFTSRPSQSASRTGARSASRRRGARSGGCCSQTSIQADTRRGPSSRPRCCSVRGS